jgi:hypothetical protein
MFLKDIILYKLMYTMYPLLEEISGICQMLGILLGMKFIFTVHCRDFSSITLCCSKKNLLNIKSQNIV